MTLQDFLARMSARQLAAKTTPSASAPAPPLGASMAPAASVVPPAPIVGQAAPSASPAMPTGTGSRVAQFTPQTQASQALRDALASPAPPLQSYRPAPVRDLPGEARRLGESALIAGAFGLGLGAPGGIAAAPTLAAAAAQGSRSGADESFANQVRMVQEQNRATEQANQDVERSRMDMLRGLQLGAQDENADNQLRMAQARAYDDQQATQEEAARRSATSESAARDKQAAARRAFLEQLAALDGPSQQAILAGAARSGELDRLGLTEYFPQDASGQFGVTLRPAPRAFAPGQDPEFVALRDRARRLQEQLKNPMIDPSVKPRLSSELAQVEAALGVGTGEGLPASAFLPMTPNQSAMLGESGANRQQRADQFRTTNALAQARLELERKGIAMRENQLQLDMMQYLDKKKGDWIKDGLPDVNKIGTEIAEIQGKIASLRTGRTIIDKYGDSIQVPPSPDELAAADQLEQAIADKQDVQTAIATRYNYTRDAFGRWVPLAPVKKSGKSLPTSGRVGSTGGSGGGAVTLPPLTVASPPLTSVFTQPAPKKKR